MGIKAVMPWFEEYWGSEKEVLTILSEALAMKCRGVQAGTRGFQGNCV